MDGKIYFVPTPIGNLKDITLRALEVLNQVDIIAAEDTRQSLKLLNHYEIKKPLISYHMHNEKDKGDYLIEKAKGGESIALVTDAGTPGISDPGSVLIKKCLEHNIHIEVLPGATAVITALVYSGLSTEGFIFKGFMPRMNKEREEFINSLINMKETIVLYEAPHRLRDALGFLKEYIPNRKIALCRELTKIHEEIQRVSISEAYEYYSAKDPKGEYVLVIQGKPEEESEQEEMDKWKHLSIEEHIKKYIDEGINKKEAVKIVARDRKLPKAEIYKHSFEQ